MIEDGEKEREGNYINLKNFKRESHEMEDYRMGKIFPVIYLGWKRT